MVKRFAFDAWGRRLSVASDSFQTTAASSSNNGGFTRGFTDHEQLDDLGLVHMNGRVYDPVLGRFLSADPFVQDAGSSQDYNRYSYVGNNPMNRVDPNGYSWLSKALGVSMFGLPYLIAPKFFNEYGPMIAGTAVAAVVSFFCGPVAGGAAGGFVSGFSGSLLNGGSVGDAFRSGAIGAGIGGATGYVSGQIGAGFDGMYSGTTSAGQAIAIEGGRALAHGVVGGAVSEAIGGEFRHGFYAGFAGSVGGSLAPHIGLPAYSDGSVSAIAMRTAFAAVVGGTASALGGGKFANGAVTSAFQHLFNAEAAAWRERKTAPIALMFMDDATRATTAGKQVVADVDAINAELDRAGYNEHVWIIPYKNVEEIPGLAARYGTSSTAFVGGAAHGQIPGDPSTFNGRVTIGGKSVHYTRFVDAIETAGKALPSVRTTNAFFCGSSGFESSARPGYEMRLAIATKHPNMYEIR